MRRHLPDLVIVGAMRSGTTSLYRYLDAHPDVSMAMPKEIHFFDRPEQHDLEWYESHFAELPPTRLHGEATPTYLASDEARSGMARLIPDARLIAVVRDPVERAWSQYWMMRARELDSRSFAEIVERELTQIRTSGPDDRRLIYLGHGMYSHHLGALAEHFPREQVHLIRFDDLRDEPRATYSGICKFLEIDGSQEPDIVGKPVNPYVSFRSLRLRRIGKRLPPLLKRAVGRINARTSADYPDMDPEIRATLIEFFAPLNEALQAEFGIDVSDWAS